MHWILINYVVSVICCSLWNSKCNRSRSFERDFVVGDVDNEGREMRTKFLLLFCTVMVLAFSNACKKEEPKMGMINVRLTDAPANVSSVNLDVKKVKVHPAESHPNADWVELDTEAGVYDVLALNNGIDALIASGSFPKGYFNVFKIELGTNNTVVADGVTYPLALPQGREPEISVEMRDFVENEKEITVLLDIDLARSIRFEGDGYVFEPVVKAVNVDHCGSVKGKVTPSLSSPVVYAISGKDTTSVFPNPDGDFMIRGLYPGTYKIMAHPNLPYQDAIVPNVNVQAAGTKDVGIIEVHQ
jgi:hypothetical protein